MCLPGRLGNVFSVVHWTSALQTGLAADVVALLLSFTPVARLYPNRYGGGLVVGAAATRSATPWRTQSSLRLLPRRGAPDRRGLGGAGPPSVVPARRPRTAPSPGSGPGCARGRSAAGLNARRDFGASFRRFVASRLSRGASPCHDADGDVRSRPRSRRQSPPRSPRLGRSTRARTVSDPAPPAPLHAGRRGPAHRGARRGPRLRAARHLPDERRVLQSARRGRWIEGMPRGLTGRRLGRELVHRLLRPGQVLDDVLAALRHGLRGDARARRARRPPVHGASTFVASSRSRCSARCTSSTSGRATSCSATRSARSAC